MRPTRPREFTCPCLCGAEVKRVWNVIIGSPADTKPAVFPTDFCEVCHPEVIASFRARHAARKEEVRQGLPITRWDTEAWHQKFLAAKASGAPIPLLYPI